MIPRLQAEEALAAAEQMAVGSGTLLAHTSQDVTRRWMRTADGERPAVPVTAVPPHALGDVGITLRRVPRKTEPSA